MDIFTNLSVQMNQAINVVDLRENDMDLINLHLMVNGRVDELSFEDALRVADYVGDLSLAAQAELWGDFSFTEREYFGLESGVFSKIAEGIKAAGRGAMKVIRAVWEAFMKVVRRIGSWFGIKSTQIADKKAKVEEIEKEIDKELDRMLDISNIPTLEEKLKAFEDIAKSKSTEIVVDGDSPTAVVVEVDLKKEDAPRGCVVVEEHGDTVTVQPKATTAADVIKEVTAGKMYSISEIAFGMLKAGILVDRFGESLKTLETTMFSGVKIWIEFYEKITHSSGVPEPAAFEKELIELLKKAKELVKYGLPVDGNITDLVGVLNDQRNTVAAKKEISHAELAVFAEKADFEKLNELRDKLDGFVKKIWAQCGEMDGIVENVGSELEGAGYDQKAIIVARAFITQLNKYLVQFMSILANSANRMLTHTAETVNVCDQVITHELSIIGKTTVVVTNVPAAKRKTQRGKRGKKK